MRLLREVIQTLALALIIYAVIQVTVQTNEVYGSSMEPSLYQGQRLVVVKLVYLRLGERDLFRSPERGDIVVLRSPGGDKLLIKRVIGLPGDVVEVKKGLVYINGDALSEAYIQEPPVYTLSRHTVPSGSYFVLGDNRNHSMDSADWENLGPVPRENIVGQAWLSFWPPSEVGRVPNFSFSR
ncbi:MAG: signal peptidase I [Dehalococcoidia bacterium]